MTHWKISASQMCAVFAIEQWSDRDCYRKCDKYAIKMLIRQLPKALLNLFINAIALQSVL